LRDPVHWLAFGFGSGLLPIAPGTWGSALAILLYAQLPQLPLVWLIAGLVLLALLGVWICGLSARRLGVHDHGGIVYDEFVGMWLVLLVTPWQPAWVLAAFLLFRLFDVWKPWPIRELDHSVPGGLGIMLDDVVAAVYAAVLIWAGQYAIAAF
jgi:phosphatidylglycerophosphatase A